MKKAIIFCAILCCTELAIPKTYDRAPQSYVQKQVVLNYAHQVAKRDGHHPNLVKGIILQESNAGQDPKMNSHASYFGVGQIKIVAAKDVLETYPSMQRKYSITSNAVLKDKLKHDPKFNVDVVSKYLEILQDRYNLRGIRLVEGYNKGPNAVKHAQHFPYAKAIQRKLAENGTTVPW